MPGLEQFAKMDEATPGQCATDLRQSNSKLKSQSVGGGKRNKVDPVLGTWKLGSIRIELRLVPF